MSSTGTSERVALPPVAAWQAARDGACVAVTPAWCALTGLRADDALGDGWLAAVDARERARARAARQAACAAGLTGTVELRYVRPDGQRRVVLCTFAPAPGGDGLVGVEIDVTAARAEADRRGAHAAATAEGLLVRDAGGAIVEASPQALALLGRHATGGAGVEDDVGHRLAGAAGGAAVAERMPDGTRRWLAVVRRALPDGGDVLVLRDVTSENRERRIVEAMHAVAAAAAADEPNDAILQALALAAALVLEVDRAAVCRLAGDGTIRVVAHYPVEGPYPHPGDRIAGRGSSAVEHAIATGGPARVVAPPPLLDEREAAGEAIAVPIVVGGRIWGTISAGAAPGERVPPAAEPRLERLAELAGLALASEDARDRLRSLAVTDPLTGMPNRRMFEERIEAEVARARRAAQPLALVLFDLDGFKSVNDRLGHPVGDRVLRAVGDALRRTARAGETVARIGGEELAWILPATDAGRALGAAERARAEIARATGAAGVRVTASAGVSELGPACTANDLVARADAALYAAKRAGRDRTVAQGPDGLARGAAVAALLVGDADRERLRSRALRDRATGLPSRDGLVVAVDELAARPGHGALLVLDVCSAAAELDEGRLDGAEQRDVASLLLELARPGEVVAHVAGGRFGWVLPGADEERARATAGLAHRRLGLLGLRPLEVATGIAVVEHSGEGRAEDGERALRRAAAAAERARRDGAGIATASAPEEPA